MRRAHVIVAALLVAAPLARAQGVRGSDPIVAERGPIALTESQVQELLRNTDPDTRRLLQSDPGALARAVRDRMLVLAVLAEAQAKQYDTRPDVIWRAERAREKSVVDSYIASLTVPDPTYPSEQDIASAYEANKARLMLPRQYHLAQIFVKAPAPDAPPGAEAEAERRAADLRAQAGARHGDFAALARRASDDHVSAANGGDLGWLRDDQMLPAVRDAVAGLPEGAVADPIRTNDGWHVIKLLGTRAAGPAPLASVRDALVRALRQQKQQQAAQAYLNGLLKDQPIQLNEIELSHLATK